MIGISIPRAFPIQRIISSLTPISVIPPPCNNAVKALANSSAGTTDVAISRNSHKSSMLLISISSP
jgi:hypothetical protein